MRLMTRGLVAAGAAVTLSLAGATGSYGLRPPKIHIPRIHVHVPHDGRGPDHRSVPDCSNGSNGSDGHGGAPGGTEVSKNGKHGKGVGGGKGAPGGRGGQGGRC